MTYKSGECFCGQHAACCDDDCECGCQQDATRLLRAASIRLWREVDQLRRDTDRATDRLRGELRVARRRAALALSLSVGAFTAVGDVAGWW